MARLARSERTRSALPSRQLSRFGYLLNSDMVFGTHRDRDAQEMRYVQWRAKQPIEGGAPGVLQHQRHTAVFVRKRDGARRPRGAKFGLWRTIVFHPPDTTRPPFFFGHP